jgi:hypothetical protein
VNVDTDRSPSCSIHEWFWGYRFSLVEHLRVSLCAGKFRYSHHKAECRPLLPHPTQLVASVHHGHEPGSL